VQWFYLILNYNIGKRKFCNQSFFNSIIR